MMSPDTHSKHLPRLLETWRSEPTIAGNIVQWYVDEAREPLYAGFPPDLHPALAAALRGRGISSLYAHQMDAWDAVRHGEHIVVVTETASGKTLCYNLPVLQSMIDDPGAKALYLFPTKALTYDQQQGLNQLSAAIATHLPPGRNAPGAGVYDGDTPAHRRSTIRGQANIILTNPDMLHTGILPHHTNWADFLRGLRYVVIDEIHTYRGVFGSHVANLVRRLKRILRFYQADPIFIMTSATIANPGQHAQRLIESPVSVIQRDGSPHGARHFLLYNPPITDANIGIRRSASAESIRLASDLLAYQVQTILFGRARRSVEIILKNLRHEAGDHASQLHAYRSGYLPGERRAIESGLRSGEVRAVVATNALELGIDIGGMDAVLLVGYPGTIAATRQQAGRAGRRSGDALAVLVASAAPLDQFLMKHPEYIRSRSPEQALINPDNPLILLQHLRCAAFEMAFSKGERFGNLDAGALQEYLAFLSETGELHDSGDRFFWMADAYPAAQISLRSTSAQPVVLQAEVDGRMITIGTVDESSAYWLVHPQAIYLHEGQTFEVETLDLENAVARLKAVDSDFYTEPQREVSVEKIETLAESDVTGAKKAWGDILVTTQTTGYRRVRWFTHEVLGAGPVDLPPTQLRTTGFWLRISDETVEKLRAENAWNSDPNNYGPNWVVQRIRARERDNFTCQVCGVAEMGRSHHVHHKTPFRQFASYLAANQLENLVTLCPSCHRRVETVVRIRTGLSGLSYTLNNLAPLFLMCDGEDLGGHAEQECMFEDGAPVVIIYDKVPAGIGLSENLYRIQAELIARAYELVNECDCKEGCPSCVGPAGENGVGGKEETLALLAALNGKTYNRRGDDHGGDRA